MKNNRIISYAPLWFFVAILLVLLSSCGLPPGKYIEHIDRSGLTRQFSTRDYHYRLQYRPADYIIAIENKGQPINKDSYRKRKNELEGQIYIQLSLIPLHQEAESSREGKYFQLEDFELMQVLLIDIGGKIYNPVFVHRQDEANGRFSILLSYEAPVKEGFSFRMEQLETEEIIFEAKEIKKIPTLKI